MQELSKGVLVGKLPQKPAVGIQALEVRALEVHPVESGPALAVPGSFMDHAPLKQDQIVLLQFIRRVPFPKANRTLGDIDEFIVPFRNFGMDPGLVRQKQSGPLIGKRYAVNGNHIRFSHLLSSFQYCFYHNIPIQYMQYKSGIQEVSG